MLLCFYAVVLCFIPADLFFGGRGFSRWWGGGLSAILVGFSPGGLPEWSHLST